MSRKTKRSPEFGDLSFAGILVAWGVQPTLPTKLYVVAA
jgi:hypothetical protein